MFGISGHWHDDCLWRKKCGTGEQGRRYIYFYFSPYAFLGPFKLSFFIYLDLKKFFLPVKKLFTNQTIVLFTQIINRFNRIFGGGHHPYAIMCFAIMQKCDLWQRCKSVVERMIFWINDSGSIGDLYEKYEPWPLPHIIYKINSKWIKI